MPKYSANISLLFPDVPFTDRLAAARAAGFDRVEFQFPYAFDLAVLAQQMQKNNQQVVMFNMPAGNFAAGDRGLAADPSAREAFRASVAQGIQVAQSLDCHMLNCLVGKRNTSYSIEAQHASIVESLRYAADEAGRHNIGLLIEMLNPIDAPGFMLPTPGAAFALRAEVGHPNLKVQYDFYHAQRTEGELAATVEKNLEHIGHIQLADNPGRHQPGTGEINYEFLLAHLDRIGYTGVVGLEYVPLGSTVDSLAWLAGAV